MKCDITQETKEFQPITVTITLETEQESILLRNLARLNNIMLIKAFEHLGYTQDQRLKGEPHDVRLDSDIYQKLSAMLEYRIKSLQE